MPRFTRHNATSEHPHALKFGCIGTQPLFYSIANFLFVFLNMYTMYKFVLTDIELCKFNVGFFFIPEKIICNLFDWGVFLLLIEQNQRSRRRCKDCVILS
ncbi:hypothetical protein EGW08_015391 [Elysia chlorotica]|uniref:Uncharacterized protein n=1 Tax=Elysia chlorotica TaxID=188477 RepID=A0A3S1B0E8_ELYCH|nr:hypothetical protein EGW08_015391 [Elysia chlorotica]